MCARPAGRRGGAVSKFGHDAAEGALPKRCLDKAIGNLGHRNNDQHLQNVLPPRRIANVGDGIHKQQQRIVPQVDAVRALADPHKRFGGQRAGHHPLGLHAGGDDHKCKDGAQQRAATILKSGVAVGERDHGSEPHEAHNAQHIDGCGRGPKTNERARLGRSGFGCTGIGLAVSFVFTPAAFRGASQTIEPQAVCETHGRQIAIGDKRHPRAQ